jgi:hypothetical protein
MGLFSKKPKPEPTPAAPLDLGDPAAIGWDIKTRWDDSRIIDVVGESQYVPNLKRVAAAKNAAAAGKAKARQFCVATLVHEPNNPHDKNAVRVDIGGLTVGYVKRSQAKNLGPRIAKRGGSYQTLADLNEGRVLSVTCWMKAGEP